MPASSRSRCRSGLIARLRRQTKHSTVRRARTLSPVLVLLCHLKLSRQEPSTLSVWALDRGKQEYSLWFFSATESESLRLRLICLALERGRREFRTHGPARTACRVLPSETERSGAASADICFQLCVTPGRTESISAAEGHPLRDEDKKANRTDQTNVAVRLPTKVKRSAG